MAVNKTDAMRRLLRAPHSTASELEQKLIERFQHALSGAKTDADRSRIVDRAERHSPGIRNMFESMGAFLVTQSKKVKAAKRVIDMLGDPNAARDDFAQLAPMDGLTVLTLCTMLDATHLERAKNLTRSKGGKASARKRVDASQKEGQKARRIAESLLCNGVGRRELAGQIAERMGVTPITVRKYLKSFPARIKRN